MNISVLSPEKEIFSGKIKSVRVPGIGGQFEILDNHAPLVAALGEGDVRMILENGKKEMYKIDSGFIEVLRNEVSLLVRAATE